MSILKDYETVFILTPVLPEDQVKDAVAKYEKVITDNGGEIVLVDNWGLKKLAYPIKKKSTGFYTVIEFKAPADAVQTLETEYRRDERVLRFLTVALDKYAVAYNERKRNKKQNQQAEPNEEVAS